MTSQLPLRKVRGQSPPPFPVMNWQRVSEMYDQVTMQCQECLSNNQLQIMSYQVKSQMERRLWLNILSKPFDENGNDLKALTKTLERMLKGHSL